MKLAAPRSFVFAIRMKVKFKYLRSRNVRTYVHTDGNNESFSQLTLFSRSFFSLARVKFPWPGERVFPLRIIKKEGLKVIRGGKTAGNGWSEGTKFIFYVNNSASCKRRSPTLERSPCWNPYFSPCAFAIRDASLKAFLFKSMGLKWPSNVKGRASNLMSCILTPSMPAPGKNRY